jgi:antitoxin (DNA-binding transcriptional repressor) of toxin-antitoxin stability system
VSIVVVAVAGLAVALVVPIFETIPPSTSANTKASGATTSTTINGPSQGVENLCLSLGTDILLQH